MFRRQIQKNGDHAEMLAGLGAESNGYLIQLRDVVKTFTTAAGDVTVLNNINAHFHRGEFVSVIGKSGSGKSTLINMITGIDRPTSGAVVVGDIAIQNLSESQMASWRGRNLGIVFQFFQLLPMLSLIENVMLPMDFCNMYQPRERKQKAMQLLSLVDMQDHADKLPTAISGGQQQRVAIARSLANDPPIIMADEPTGNLDSKTAESVFALFEDLVAKGKTVVMVTHDSTLAKRATRTLLIADGEIVNEWVQKALPTLTENQMLLATRHLNRVSYQPGQDIIQQDQPTSDLFYIISKGEVEITLKRGNDEQVVVSTMGPGQYFGEIEILKGGSAIANVRAGNLPVEVFTLDREKIMDLVATSPETREVLEKMVAARRAENLSARKDPS